jgi:hypothetical protein
LKVIGSTSKKRKKSEIASALVWKKPKLDLLLYSEVELLRRNNEHARAEIETPNGNIINGKPRMRSYQATSGRSEKDIDRVYQQFQAPKRARGVEQEQ